MLSVLTVALAALSPQCPLPSENRIFDKVRTSFPMSVPNAMGVSDDGDWIYAGEGGSIAFLDTTLPNGGGYGNVAERVPISRYGARPAKILFDPGPGSGREDDALIICAGRSGLWVMDAHPSGSTHRAAIVDDSGNGVLTTQNGRRFCNDAVIFTVDGVDYVAAIFARRNGSRLRIYDLASVRGVLASTPAGAWSGGEILPLHDVKLKKRPGMLTQTDPATSTHNYLLSVGLDVDQVDSDEAMLYVALWHQGLGRVHVESDGSGGLDVSGLQYGPVFGKGSWYHLHSTPTEQREWYSNYSIREGSEVYREEPPVFTDVAVQNFCGRYLYATVDTVGWVRFDLSDPTSNPWSDQMPIDYQAGAPYPAPPDQHPFGEIQLGLGDDYTYPKQVRVVQIDAQRALLAVNTTGVTMVQPVGYRTEGSVFDHGAATFNGIPARYFLEEAILRGENGIYLYEIACDGTVGDPTVVSTDGGAEAIPAADLDPLSPIRKDPFGAKDMALLAGPGADEATLFLHSKQRTAKFLVTVGPPISYQEEGARVLVNRAGYESLVIGHSIVNPDVLMLGTNDGGFPAPGILATCGSDLVRFYDPDENGSDGRYAMGNFFDQEGQWEVLSDNQFAGMQFSIGTNDFKYRLRLYDPGDPCADPQVEPKLEHTWLIKTRTHRLGARDRWYFQGTVNDAYDADTGREMLFVSATQTPEGIVAFDRQQLEDWVFANMTGTPENPDKTILDIVQVPQGVVVAKLNTDPEFRNVPNGRDPGDPTHRFLQTQTFPGDPEQFNISGRLQTFTPRTMKLPSAQGGGADTWVLAAPCGFLENGEQDVDSMGQNFESYTQHPEWRTDPAYEDFTRLLVQFWDVDDPDVLALTSSDPDDKGIPAHAAFVGGFDSANALHVNLVEQDGRTFLFVGDFGGRVEVLDVTDVLWDSTEPVKSVETWTPTTSLTDNLANNVWEVAVDRAQWSSGGVDYDEIYAYVAVERVGIEVLHFDPACAPGERLKKVGLIQTPGNVRSMVIREDGPDKTLILTDGEAGLRVLEYTF